jgi:hypothetical protein
MKRAKTLYSVVAVMTCLLFAGDSRAATIQTFGAGSAVSSVDRSATFDSLNANNVVHLDTYQEGSLRIITSGDSWAADLNMSARLDPFHGANALDRAFHATAWGNEDWVSIQTTNRSLIYGIEFMYGNCWTTGDIFGPYPWGNEKGFVEWQTLINGALVSAGQIGPNPMLPLGTILGFYDPAGFDELLVRCRIENVDPPNLQTIALDNLQVMLTNLPPAPAIYGSDLSVNPATGAPVLAVYDTIVGLHYRMVYTESLASLVWNPVNVPLPEGWQPGGGTLIFTDSGAAGRPQRFYRVQVR